MATTNDITPYPTSIGNTPLALRSAKRTVAPQLAGALEATAGALSSIQAGMNRHEALIRSLQAASAKTAKTTAATNSGTVTAITGQDASTLDPSDPNYWERWLDANGIQHVVLNAILACSADAYPIGVGIWLDQGDGQGPQFVAQRTIPSGSSEVAIGFDGDTAVVLTPVYAAGSWTLTAAGGAYNPGDAPPAGAVTSASFTVAAPPALAATAATNAYIDQINYYPGKLWGWLNLFTDLPYADPNFVKARWTVQNGHYTSPGNPATFVAGASTAFHSGKEVPITDDDGEDVHRLPGSSTVSVTKTDPAKLWPIPDAKFADGSANPDNVFRLRNLVASPLAQDVTNPYTWTYQNDWSSGVGVSTPGTAAYFDVVLDLTQGLINTGNLNPSTLTTPLSMIGGALGVTNAAAAALMLAAQGAGYSILANQSVVAANMAANSVTAANAALAALAVVDSNVAAVHIGKVIAGTVIFTGDVFLARGSGYPCVQLGSAAIYLWSSATTGGSSQGETATATGLTSAPYVAISSGGIGLYSGGNPSATVTSSAATFWSVSGNTSNPYAQMSSSGFIVYAGSFTSTFSASGVGFAYAGGFPSSALTSTSLTLAYSSSIQFIVASTGLIFQNNTCVLDIAYVAGTGYVMQLWSAATVSSGVVTGNTSYPCVGLSQTQLSIAAGSYLMTLSSSQIQMSVTSGPSVTLSAGSGLVMGNGGGSYGYIGIAVTSTQHYIEFSGLFGAMNLYTQSGAGYLSLGTSTYPTQIVLAGQFPSPYITMGGNQVLTVRQTGLGSPSGWADATALAWAQSLYTKISNHGLIT